jgi:PPOX class probable F420-dependent enzyme
MVVNPDRLERPGVGGQGEVAHGGPLIGGGHAHEVEAPSLRHEKSKSHGAYPIVEAVRMSGGWARARFADARVARLATADALGRPHLVPIVFACDGDALYTAVDAKPKSGARLRRLDNIDANPAVSVLVDHYEDDWRRLWWARADGRARIVSRDDQEGVRAMAALTERYAQYRAAPPPGPVIVIEVRRWSAWSATQAAAES